MSTNMVNALVMTEPGTLVEQDFTRPRVGAGQGLLEVVATGLCGSDLASYQGTRAHDGPTILGHEVVGRIAEIGPAAAADWGVSPGDRVVVEEALPCMACSLCLSGRHRLCKRSGLRYGHTSITRDPSLWGGFSEYMFLHENSQLHRIPDAVSDKAATLYIPLSNGLGWLSESAELQPGDTVVVFGPGQHGVAAALAAQRLGADQVHLVGMPGDERRLLIAANFGCRTHVAPTEDELLDATGGGANVVVDVTPGAAAPVRSAIRIASPAARIVFAGLKRDQPVNDFPLDAVMEKELTLRGVWARPSWAIPAALRWLAEDSLLASLCDHACGLAGLDEAFQAMAASGPERPLHVAVLNGLTSETH